MQVMTLFVNIALAVLLIVILIIYEAKWQDRIKTKWVKIAITVIFATVIVPLVFVLLSSWSERTDRVKEEKFRQAILKSIHEDKTSVDRLDALLKLRYKDIFETTETEAEEWAKAFLASLDQRRSKITDLQNESHELGQRLTARWQPLYEYILSSVDNRASALTKETGVSISTGEDHPLLVVNSVTRSKKRVRVITFPNGAMLAVDADSGNLDRGVLVRHPQLIFREERDGNTDIIFWLRFKEKSIEINRDKRHEDAIQDRKLTGDFLSQENRAILQKAINYSMEWLYF